MKCFHERFQMYFDKNKLVSVLLNHTKLSPTTGVEQMLNHVSMRGHTLNKQHNSSPLLTRYSVVLRPWESVKGIKHTRLTQKKVLGIQLSQKGGTNSKRFVFTKNGPV